METRASTQRTVLKFQGYRFDNITPELLAKTMWMSTALAMIFALPPVAMFAGLYQAGVNLGIAAGVSFGIHFVTLAFAKRISAGLSRFFG